MKNKKKVSLKEIERMAEQGRDTNSYFSKGEIMPPLKEVQRVNVDFTVQMLSELDQMARDLNISRQAVIKSLLMQALDQHQLANKKRGRSGS